MREESQSFKKIPNKLDIVLAQSIFTRWRKRWGDFVLSFWKPPSQTRSRQRPHPRRAVVVHLRRKAADFMKWLIGDTYYVEWIIGGLTAVLGILAIWEIIKLANEARERANEERNCFKRMVKVAETQDCSPGFVIHIKNVAFKLFTKEFTLSGFYPSQELTLAAEQFLNNLGSFYSFF